MSPPLGPPETDAPSRAGHLDRTAHHGLRMSQQDIDDYFAQLPQWMKNDIGREIRLAIATRGEHRGMLEQLGLLGGGNLLAALGLLAYTEALGGIRYWNAYEKHGKPELCFLAFFDAMEGGSYSDWRLAWEARHCDTTLYETLRCGLAHEYRPKIASAFYIADGAPFALDEDAEGRLIFRVEPYFRHFSAEADRLHEELRQLPDPQIPPPYFKRRTIGRHQPPFRSLTVQPSS